MSFYKNIHNLPTIKECEDVLNRSGRSKRYDMYGTILIEQYTGGKYILYYDEPGDGNETRDHIVISSEDLFTIYDFCQKNVNWIIKIENRKRPFRRSEKHLLITSIPFIQDLTTTFIDVKEVRVFAK